MSLYIAQEFLGVLLVLAGLMGTVLFFGIAAILFQEGIRRTLRGANSRVKPLAKLSAKELWMRRAGVGPIQQSRPHA
ncbi:MAG TPA: hypothetical protein VK703_08345 [Candidatus Acidoferrales bacterium]|jgi:hypothetical protein|nr:hypothetical protein [Candidatus Acidoferrales bacterium]